MSSITFSYIIIFIPLSTTLVLKGSSSVRVSRRDIPSLAANPIQIDTSTHAWPTSKTVTQRWATVAANILPKHRTQQTRDIDPMLLQRLWRWSNIGSMYRVCWVGVVGFCTVLEVPGRLNVRMSPTKAPLQGHMVQPLTPLDTPQI